MRTIAERTADLSSALAALADKIKADIRTAMPCIIESFDAVRQTVTVQPAVREQITRSGYVFDLEIPLLADVPLVLPRAGGYGLMVAPKKGDECLVVFADMCIDAWWQSGGVQSQADRRRHDLSDAFAILGTWSQQNKPSIPAEGISLQNDDGTARVGVNEDGVNIMGEIISDQIATIPEAKLFLGIE